MAKTIYNILLICLLTSGLIINPTTTLRISHNEEVKSQPIQLLTQLLQSGLTIDQSELYLSGNDPDSNYFPQVKSLKRSLHYYDASFPNDPVQAILFADDQNQLQFFTKTFDVKKVYNYLRAVTMEVDSNTYIEVKSKYPDKFFIFNPWNDTSVYAPEPYNDSIHETLISTDVEPQLSQSGSIGSLLNLENLWTAGYNGSGVTTAVIDNGIDFTHTLLENKSAGIYDISSSSTSPCKTHGTSVAGLIGAGDFESEMFGMAPGSKLIDIHFGCVGSGVEGDLLAGFDYIIENNATIDIVNTSFDANLPPWDIILERIVNTGIIVVGSAGNSGPGLHTTRTGGPGNSIHGISVGSTDFDMDISFFSSWGPSTNMIYKPDIMAPGERILTTTLNNELGEATGTSFSSPIVAGGIATIISALRANNISWNMGVIKAALLKAATSLNEEELVAGQGFANFGQMWEILLQAELGNDMIPQIVKFTPTIGPFPYLKSVPKGVNISFPVTLISSHPSDTDFTVEGDLNGHVSISQPSGSFSQQIMITVDTSTFEEFSTINGSIVATVGNDSSSTYFDFQVNSQIKGKIGIDLGHTYLDQLGENQIGGSNTGKMIQLMYELGYMVEEINGTITSEMLSNYDLIWLPNPNRLMKSSSGTQLDSRFQQNSLLVSEISAIHNYVENGGNLIITTNGLFSQTKNGQTYDFGLNATGLNELIAPYGIEAITDPITPPTTRDTFYITNSSSLTNGVNSVSYWGNYLGVSPNAWVIGSGDSGEKGIAYYQDPDGTGKVLISSTDYWTNNIALYGGYPESRTGNYRLAENAVDWFFANSFPIKMSQNITNQFISGSFKQVKSGIISIDSPHLYLEKNRLIQYQELETVISNDTFSFTYEIPGDGIYRIISQVGSQYIAWSKTIDTTPPLVIASESNPNNTVVQQADQYQFDFSLEDTVTGLNSSSLYVTLDGNASGVDLIFNMLNGRLEVLFSNENLDNGPLHRINISISDNFDNHRVYNYIFNIQDEGVIDPTSSDQGFSERSSTNSILSTPFDTFFALLVARLIITYRSSLNDQ